VYAERHVVTLTTNAGGDATGYTPVVTGRVLAIRYVKTDYADGIDFTVTLDATGEAVMVGTNVNATATFYPRVGVTDAAGAAATLDGTRLLRDAVVAAEDRVKIVVAQGGNTKTGAFHIVVG
jgi:hypothetical protein